MDSSPPGSPVHGILQARIQEWVAISFSIVNIKGTPISPFKANLTDFPHLLQPSSSGYSSSALSEQLSSFLHQKLRSLHCQLPLFATKSYILLSLEYLPKICLLLSSSSWPNLPSGLAWTATIVTPFQLPYSFPPAAWVISLLNLLRGHTSLSLPPLLTYCLPLCAPTPQTCFHFFKISFSFCYWAFAWTFPPYWTMLSPVSFEKLFYLVF